MPSIGRHLNAQADLSLRWAHRSFCWFCHEVAHLLYTKNDFVDIFVVHSGEWEVMGLISGHDIPQSLKMVLAAPRLALRLTG